MLGNERFIESLWGPLGKESSHFRQKMEVRGKVLEKKFIHFFEGMKCCSKCADRKWTDRGKSGLETFAQTAPMIFQHYFFKFHVKMFHKMWKTFPYFHMNISRIFRIWIFKKEKNVHFDWIKKIICLVTVHKWRHDFLLA